MKLYKIMNYTIILLMIAAVYQTGELWLQGTSSRSFFSLMAETTSSDTVEMEEITLLPTAYAISGGEGAFTMYYPEDGSNQKVLTYAEDVLAETIADRNLVVETDVEVDWKTLLAQRTVVWQYDFLLSGNDYFVDSILSANEMDMEFDCMIMAPSRRLGENTSIYFVNSSTNTCVSYITKTSSVGPDLYELLATDVEKNVYISTGQKIGSSVIGRNLFLPQWAELPYAYQTVLAEPTFVVDGVFSRTDMEDTVKGFFRNFSVDWSNQDADGTYIFSDNETVINYEPDIYMLEYYNYDSYGNDANQTSLLEGYQISKNFLSNDNSLNTEIYLADVKKRSNETVYYFDYVVGEFPISLSRDLLQTLEVEHAIEVCVRNDSVKQYRRYMVNFEESEEERSLDVQFIDALDDANKTYQLTVEDKAISEVMDISLEYYVEQTGEAGLKWLVTLYEYVFVTESNMEDLLM
ncbi:hypothetical protein [Chakrabartyella piscis]|uniref:hypothetical protein n=1 Tax=Chakrabartyella piscis TaxID=2918914 RepID=UPI00295879B4|nr:hypothetical protein [Chakrabartyella piscis]